MKITDEIVKSLNSEWIPCIYKDQVRSERTRSYSFDIPERENKAVIEQTLLGISLKVGKRRFSCPDLSTARYLRIFALIGCGKFAVPYDITKIPGLANQLEASWHKMFALLEKQALGKTPQILGKIRAGLLRNMRSELYEIGDGQKKPDFKTHTKQRKTGNMSNGSN